MTSTKHSSSIVRLVLALAAMALSSAASAKGAPPPPDAALSANLGAPYGPAAVNPQPSQFEKLITDILTGRADSQKTDNASVDARVRAREENIKAANVAYERVKAYSDRLAEYERELQKSDQETARDNTQVDQARAAEKEARERARKAAADARAQGAPSSPGQSGKQIGQAPPVQETDSDTLYNHKYQFKSPVGHFSDELKNIQAGLKSANPRNDRERTARSLGLRSLVFADEAYFSGDVEKAWAYREMAETFLDIALGFTPGISWGKDLYEALSGKNLVTGKPLTDFERGCAVFGALTGGVGSKSKYGMKAIDKGANLISPMVKYTATKWDVFAQGIVRSGIAERIAKARLKGVVEISEGTYKVLDKAAPLRNPLPKGDVYGHAVERQWVKDLLAGNSRMGGPHSPEGWITAAEDVDGYTRANLAERLSLYSDDAGTILKDTSDYVVIEFKFKNPIDPPTYTPTNFDREFPRLRGWIPGGRTKGGAREWIVNPEIFSSGLIDQSSIVIRELKP